jgi:cytochrome c556
MKLKTLAPLCLVGAMLSMPAAAQFQTPESAIKYRQGAFSVMAAHFARISMMSQGIQPFDAKAAAENADLVASLAKLPFTAFSPGSDKGVPNRATAAIWKESDKFKIASDRMIENVSKLQVATKSGDIEAIKAATGALGRTCKACHDDFRGSVVQ